MAKFKRTELLSYFLSTCRKWGLKPVVFDNRFVSNLSSEYTFIFSFESVFKVHNRSTHETKHFKIYSDNQLKTLLKNYGSFGLEYLNTAPLDLLLRWEINPKKPTNVSTSINIKYIYV